MKICQSKKREEQTRLKNFFLKNEKWKKKGGVWEGLTRRERKIIFN